MRTGRAFYKPRDGGWPGRNRPRLEDAPDTMPGARRTEAPDGPSRPAGQIVGDQGGEIPRPVRVGIETGNVAESAAARLQEGLAAAHVDFLQGLQAVRQKPRAHQIHRADAFPPPGFERGLSVG